MEGNAHLRGGWGEPERGFVWSEGKAASIVVPVTSAKSMIAISLWGYVPNGLPAQEVLIFVNTQFKGFFEINDKSIISLNVESVTEAQEIEITFYMPLAISPEKAEGLPDTRRLGVALATLQIS
jgi:hypothetical protein